MPSYPYHSSHITLSSQRAVFYTVWQGDRTKTTMPKLNKPNTFSKKSQQRIRDYINLLIDCSTNKTVYSRETRKHYRFKVNFITLTLPSDQCHTDNEIHEKCFKTFIRAVKQKHKGFLYIYKAEVTDRGMLHYHLTTNSYLHYEYLRNTWNYYVNKLGYVDRSRSANPNSTDVHAVLKINNLAAYLCKYLSKADVHTKVLQRYFKRYGKQLKNRERLCCDLPNNYFRNIKRKVTIRRWDCSKALKIGKCVINEPDDRMYNELREIELAGGEYVELDYVKIWRLNRELLARTKYLQGAYNNFKKSVVEYNKQVNHNIII